MNILKIFLNIRNLQQFVERVIIFILYFGIIYVFINLVFMFGKLKYLLNDFINY